MNRRGVTRRDHRSCGLTHSNSTTGVGRGPDTSCPSPGAQGEWQVARTYASEVAHLALR
ncbi:hypothetical protein J2S47_002241 [Streptomyces griseoviridis]|uniref:Uncharacterized protein n=1 Tax=Streptomyces griseoviridis TaxID=45398 RepID=A0ABT9LDK9_STRGD|nr:hypothetical protein [Streptomyces griseoviridis]